MDKKNNKKSKIKEKEEVEENDIPEEKQNIFTRLKFENKYEKKTDRNKYIKRKKYTSYVIIDDRKWYRIFKSQSNGTSLEENYDTHKIHQGIVISLDDIEEGRLFTLFKDYIELYNYMKDIDCLNFLEGNINPPAFFEVILGKKLQKPHFDIEIVKEKFEEDYPELIKEFEKIGEQLIRHLIKAIIEIIPDIQIERDILLYSSHGTKQGKEKRSYHLIINNYCHMDHEEAGYFYKKVIEKIKYFSEYIDHSVYSCFQQFRLLGCEKPESGRPKIFHETFKIGKNKYKHIYSDPSISKNLAMFQESLVGFTSLCKLLPNYKPLIDKKVYESEEISQRQAEEAFKMLEGDCRYFVIKDVTSIIMLKRLKPSYCKICEKIHDAENPFLTIYKDKVYFFCRRNLQGKKLYLGNLITGKDEEQIEDGQDQEGEEDLGLPPSDINLDDFEDVNGDTKEDKEGNKETNKGGNKEGKRKIRKIKENIVTKKDNVDEAQMLANLPLPKIDKKRFK